MWHYNHSHTLTFRSIITKVSSLVLGPWQNETLSKFCIASDKCCGGLKARLAVALFLDSHTPSLHHLEHNQWQAMKMGGDSLAMRLGLVAVPVMTYRLCPQWDQADRYTLSHSLPLSAAHPLERKEHYTMHILHNIIDHQCSLHVQPPPLPSSTMQ